MSEEKTIDQKNTLWNNRVLLSSFAVLILGTNAFNAYIHQQETNTFWIEYNAEADKRRLTHAIEKHEYKAEIKDLREKIKNCN